MQRCYSTEKKESMEDELFVKENKLTSEYENLFISLIQSDRTT